MLTFVVYQLNLSQKDTIYCAFVRSAERSKRKLFIVYDANVYVDDLTISPTDSYKYAGRVYANVWCL